MKLNKKGITLIEIIISIVLISIVLIFLFTMLIAVNDMNSESEMDSTYLINKSLFIKNVEEDLKDANPDIPLEISGCSINDDGFFKAYNEGELKSNEKANECIKLSYTDINAGTKEAYIGIFYLKTQTNYVISYANGNSKSTRVLPDFEKYNVDDSGIKHKIEVDVGTATESSPGFASIEIPIIGSDGKDYTIIIPYYGKVTNNYTQP